MFNLNDLKTVPTQKEGTPRDDAFVHLNAIKVDWGSTANVIAAYLIPSEERLDISKAWASKTPDVLYDLKGRRVTNPQPVIYIRNGRKILIK